MPALPAVELWLAFWVGMAVGVVLGALIFSLLAINNGPD